jgi:hypothetical protein
VLLVSQNISAFDNIHVSIFNPFSQIIYFIIFMTTSLCHFLIKKMYYKKGLNIPRSWPWRPICCVYQAKYQNLLISCLSNNSILRVPDEGYSRNASLHYRSGEVYSLQHYVIQSQWLATGRWFSPGTSFPPPINSATI